MLTKDQLVKLMQSQCVLWDHLVTELKNHKEHLNAHVAKLDADNRWHIAICLGEEVVMDLSKTWDNEGDAVKYSVEYINKLRKS